MSVRSSIVRSLDNLKAVRLVISELTGERSRDEGQVVYPSEIDRSWSKVEIVILSQICVLIPR